MDGEQRFYRVDYHTRSGWRAYFLAESREVAKAYLDIWQDKPLKWFENHGVEMARERRLDGSYTTMRITATSLVTADEVAEIKARKEVQKAKVS